MVELSISDRLKVYTRYIGHKVILTSKEVGVDTVEGVLMGVNSHSIQISIEKQNRWIPLYDNFELYDIKLVLKPLKMLTETIRETANRLPIQNFITQYYVQLGFDMPMFFSPEHPGNCRYITELGMAVYSSDDNFKEDLPSRNFQHLTVVTSN
ncbi:hypothetical protein ACFSJU_14085 [Paradesertivirga mongoliensis]|uniref:Uncharacterized protein n=1 Tax=Paradesertivirga mongoliensis TaxID=2100740 RepID=A0ABW4ZN59_9SPHI|nr:hypothetical protein [Pedobacter mongoliensis]